MSLSVGNEVDLILSALLLEALLGAPVLANAAADQDNDESPHQPEPWNSVPVNTHLLALITCKGTRSGVEHVRLSSTYVALEDRTMTQSRGEELTPQFIVVAATLAFPTAVAPLTHVALVVHSLAHQLALQTHKFISVSHPGHSSAFL